MWVDIMQTYICGGMNDMTALHTSEQQVDSQDQQSVQSKMHKSQEMES